MGIPAAFRWLSTKYPKIISPVAEDLPVEMEDGTIIPVDTTKPNPNEEEFDNLYLDMNGIVHPCSHPEDRPAPKDEEEMMLEVFKYTDRVVNMVRPRKLLMIAVDGVAPRAKMNQQRSRRFRSAQEAKEKEADKEEQLKMLKKQNGTAPHFTPTKAFDSNSITPGTPFMDILAASLRYWCAYKLNTDPGWAKMKVIISDATVPGEGEHKIMNFIRSQRSSPDHDPNTRHVIYGLDADLIMLGLATHEPHFRVLREDVFAQQQSRIKSCKLCGQKGHEAMMCKGEAKQKEGEFGEKEKAAPLKPFIWLHVAVLREYLAVELHVSNLPFRWDLERAIDDWIFMCCFVGNDFLPHLPALEIRENGINTLTAIWRDNLPYMGGFVTRDGHIDLNRAQYILEGLAKQEDAIFRRRKEQEDRREANAKRRKTQENGSQRVSSEAATPREGITHEMVVNHTAILQQANLANRSAASVLRSKIQSATSKETFTPDDPAASSTDTSPKKVSEPEPSTTSVLGKRKKPPTEDEAEEQNEPVDEVRLWEDGYADRYYTQKFHVAANDTAFRREVARCYVEGLAWVVLYYFQGCPSWEWYYPYHYAPFAADFVNIKEFEIKFEKGRIAKPYEQLMSVLPAASRHALPEVFHDLMLDPDSDVIDFYPEEFRIDLNGKKFAWQGVALLPFIEMLRLLAAVEQKYPQLSKEEAARNGLGKDVLMLCDANHDLYDDITSKFYSKKQGLPRFQLNTRVSKGLSGHVAKAEDYIPHGRLSYPLGSAAMPDLDYDHSLSVIYKFLELTHPHKSMILRGALLSANKLTRSDIEVMRSKMVNSGQSYGGAPLGRDNGTSRRGHISYAPDGGYGSRGRGRGDYHRSGPPPPHPPPSRYHQQGQQQAPRPPPPSYQGGRPVHSYGNDGGYNGGGYYRIPPQIQPQSRPLGGDYHYSGRGNSGGYGAYPEEYRERGGYSGGPRQYFDSGYDGVNGGGGRGGRGGGSGYQGGYNSGGSDRRYQWGR